MNEETQIPAPTLQEIGYDQYLRNPLSDSAPAQSSIQTDRFIESLSGSTINVGKISSADGRTVLDITGGDFSVRDSSNERVRIGYLGNKEYGIKVSKAGFDASSATSDQLVMSSEFDMFKIVQIFSGGWTIDFADASGSIVIPHTLGYKPMVFASLNGGFGLYMLPCVVDGSLSFNVIVDVNDITLEFNRITGGGSGTATLDYKVYAMRETAN